MEEKKLKRNVHQQNNENKLKRVFVRDRNVNFEQDRFKCNSYQNNSDEKQRNTHTQQKKHVHTRNTKLTSLGK